MSITPTALKCQWTFASNGTPGFHYISLARLAYWNEWGNWHLILIFLFFLSDKPLECSLIWFSSFINCSWLEMFNEYFLIITFQNLHLLLSWGQVSLQLIIRSYKGEWDIRGKLALFVEQFVLCWLSEGTQCTHSNNPLSLIKNMIILYRAL